MLFHENLPKSLSEITAIINFGTGVAQVSSARDIVGGTCEQETTKLDKSCYKIGFC